MTNEDLETYVDCAGRIRQFRLFEWETPVGWYLRAEEWRDGEPTGFDLLERIVDEVPTYYVLRQRIRERLARRDLVRHPETGRLESITGRFNGQIVRGDGEELGLWADGDWYSWDQIIGLLEAHEGWGLRIEICEAGTE